MLDPDFVGPRYVRVPDSEMLREPEALSLT